MASNYPADDKTSYPMHFQRAGSSLTRTSNNTIEPIHNLCLNQFSLCSTNSRLPGCHQLHGERWS